MSDATVRPFDKFLPDQPRNNEHYAGAAEDYHRVLFETLTRASGIQPPAKEFVLEGSSRFTVEEMGSNPINLRLLELLVRLVRAERVLEIGAFIGVSALHMARGLPENGKLVTIEKFPEFAEIARKNFHANGFGERIELLVGDANDRIRELPKEQPFDLIFIDGNKERYAEYFEALEPLLRPGGLFVVDDVLFHGDVLNATPRTEKGAGALRFLKRATRAEGYLRAALPLANGVMLLLKR
jgi:predicted O-methyltransferase YrrM